MFVYSVKSSKLKGVALVVVIALAIGALVYLAGGDKPATSEGGISLKAGTAEERIAFLSQFGWEIDEEPLEVMEVIIPAEFDETYTAYNEMQKEHSLDLEPYRGKRCKRWTFAVSNYPGYESKAGLVQANLLVLDGVVIGGDVCSVELGGFMQGFDYPQEAATTAAQTTALSTTIQ